ncbi:MAG: hypothetical protein IMF12_07000 [Proteobacteria bacterium]|nr:hypothetical protein [Pseudomonadota bacterium]
MPNIWDDNYAVSDFNDTSVFDCEEPSPKEEHLKNLLTNEKQRMFCQYDLRYFFSYNKSSVQYKFTKLSDADENMIEEGKDVFYLEENYFVYGPIIEIRRNRDEIFIRCDFEDGNREEFSVSECKENLYFIEMKI